MCNIEPRLVNFLLTNNYKVINLPIVKIPTNINFYLKLSEIYNVNNNIIDLQCSKLNIVFKILQLIEKKYIIKDNYYINVTDDEIDPFCLGWIDLTICKTIHIDDCKNYNNIYDYQMKDLEKWYHIIKY